MKRSSKLWLAGALIVTGGLISRFAYSYITQTTGVVCIILGMALFLGGMILFTINFRE